MVCDCGQYDESCLTCAHCQAAVCQDCIEDFMDSLWEAEIDETVRHYVLCRSCVHLEWELNA